MSFGTMLVVLALVLGFLPGLSSSQGTRAASATDFSATAAPSERRVPSLGGGGGRFVMASLSRFTPRPATADEATAPAEDSSEPVSSDGDTGAATEPAPEPDPDPAPAAIDDPTPSEPSDPAPSEPAPTDPAVTDPAPSEPAPTAPAPTDPVSEPGGDTTSVDPTVTDPAATDPAPTAVVATDPAGEPILADPVEPATADIVTTAPEAVAPIASGDIVTTDPLATGVDESAGVVATATVIAVRELAGAAARPLGELVIGLRRGAELLGPTASGEPGPLVAGPGPWALLAALVLFGRRRGTSPTR